MVLMDRWKAVPFLPLRDKKKKKKNLTVINDTRLHRRFESLKTSLYSINYHKLTINYQQTTIPDRFPSRNFIISIWIVLLTYFPGEEIVVKIMSNTNRFRIVATHVLIIRGYDRASLIDSFLSFFFFFFFFFS